MKYIISTIKEDHYNFSSQSIMTELYTLLQTIINQGTAEALDQLFTSLNQNPGEPSKEFACGQNIFYALKRFVTASLARDPKIKENVFGALTQFKSRVPHVTSISKPAYQEFFLSATDMTDCKTKQQKSAYIQGKINVVRTLAELFTASDKVVGHFVQLANENENLQEELIEAIYTLVGDKIKGLKFTLAEGSNSKILLSILLKKTISKETIQTILTSAVNQYPKQSITLKYLGLNLATILPTPNEFFTSQYAKFINTTEEQTEDGDLKRLYYLLWVQKYFLENVTIGPQNVNRFLSSEMAVVWLEELRVKNKHMRKVAGEITIKFEENPQFAFQVLKLLHEKKVYLQNISQNHPFTQLYSNVDTVKFWTYLVELINVSQPSENKDQIVEEEEEEKLAKKEEYLSELEFITREKVGDLTPELIGQTLAILIKAYQQSKRSQKLLNLIWSLFHSLLLANEFKKKSKKKIVLNLRGPLILSKISLTSLEFESEIVEILQKVIKFLRIKAKTYKEQQNPDKLMVAFLNFVTGLIIYCIVYPEQADVCGEVEFVFKDLQILVAKERGNKNVQVEKKKNKKQKNQEPEDFKKPVHVLIDVFISLLTKAPIFLRNSINLVFEQLVPFIQSSDLDTLLDVILKPDQEYIEEI